MTIWNDTTELYLSVSAKTRIFLVTNTLTNLHIFNVCISSSQTPQSIIMIASRTLLLILTGTSFTCCECFTSTNSYKYTYNGIDTGTMNHSPSACQAYKENPFQNTMAFAAAVSVHAASLLAVPNAAIASLDDSNNNYKIIRIPRQLVYLLLLHQF